MPCPRFSKLLNWLFKLSIFGVDMDFDQGIFQYFARPFYQKQLSALNYFEIFCSVLLVIFYTLNAAMENFLDRNTRILLADLTIISGTNNRSLQRIFAFNTVLMLIFILGVFVLFRLSNTREKVTKALILTLLDIPNNDPASSIVFRKYHKLVMIMFKNIKLDKDRNRVLTFFAHVHMAAQIFLQLYSFVGCFYAYQVYGSTVSYGLLSIVSFQVQVVVLMSTFQYGLFAFLLGNKNITIFHQQCIMIYDKMQHNANKAKGVVATARKEYLKKTLRLLRSHNTLCVLTSHANFVIGNTVFLYLPVLTPLSLDVLYILLHKYPEISTNPDIIQVALMFGSLTLILVTTYLIYYVIVYRISKYNQSIYAVNKHLVALNALLLETGDSAEKLKLLGYYERITNVSKGRFGVSVGNWLVITRLFAAKFTIAYCRYTILTQKLIGDNSIKD